MTENLNEETLEDVFSSLSIEEKKPEWILSIDVGVIHLSLVLCRVDSKDGKLLEVCSTNLVNIKEYTHTTISKEECTLPHTKTFFDWLRHMVQENSFLFEKADIILIERQPPAGWVVVEQILYGFFRDKTVLLSPNSVHCFHKFQGLDYDQRKTASEIIATPYLSEELQKQVYNFDRAHDVSDAILQLLYFLDKNKEKEKKECVPLPPLPSLPPPLTNFQSCLTQLERYRYTRKLN